MTEPAHAPSSRRLPPIALAAAVAGLLALALHLGAGALHGGQWRALQRRYSALQTAAGRAPIAVAIRASSPRGGADEQRCVSCHLGMALPDAFPGERPFQPHPPTGCGLPLAAIGCGGCHRGQPLALTVEGAHALASADPRRVLDWRARPRGPREARQRREARRRLQAGCAPCHVDRRGGALRYDPRAVPEVAAGQARFVEQGCFSCHRVTGIYTAAERGPQLDTVGVRLARAALVDRLERPQQASPDGPALAAMPPTSLAGAELAQLVAFLVARVGLAGEPGTSRREALAAARRPVDLLDSVAAKVPPRASETAGALWATAAGCRGCHRLDGEAHGVPDLRRVGWYARAEELSAVLERPAAERPGTAMPALPLPAAVRDSLVAFMLEQRHPLPSTATEVLGEVCAACHGAGERPPDAKVVVLARRPPRLSRAAVPRQRFVEAVTSGRTKTAMAPWGRFLGRRLIERLYRSLPTSGRALPSSGGAPR